MRSGKWKLIFYHDTKRNKNRFELYDLEADIGEKNDLYEKYPEVVAELKKELKKQFAEKGAQMPLIDGKPVEFPESRVGLRVCCRRMAATLRYPWMVSR